MSLASPTYPQTAYMPGPQYMPMTIQLGKLVVFELVLPGNAQSRSRLHMRVRIWPHDDTESIVSTVKNFFGIYPTPGMTVGVSFESQDGATLIARYENFVDNMVVLVRAIEEPPVELHSPYRPHHAPNDEYHHHNHSHNHLNQYPHQQHRHSDYDRDIAAAALVDSAQSESPVERSPSSPVNDRHDHFSGGDFFYRHDKQSASPKNGGAPEYCESIKSYASGETESSAASNHPKDPIPNTEISVENIVEGGRRKRAKFESSELPLFAPLQMPATMSNQSASPVRRISHHHRSSLPFVSTSHSPYGHNYPLPSPQAHYSAGGTHPATFTTPAPDANNRRYRNSISCTGSSSNGVLLTPDPTISSCVSDEDKDVAIQLMRLCGEPHGGRFGENTFRPRTDRAWTMSATATSNETSDCSDDDSANRRRHKHSLSMGNHPMYPMNTSSHFVPYDANSPLAGRMPSDNGARVPITTTTTSTKPKLGPIKTSLPTAKPKPAKIKGPRPAGITKAKKVPNQSNGNISPLPASPSRTNPMASLAMAALASSGGCGDDDVVDLSSKPRCQRCRKSKKGCDRQRPCGRCKDAGILAADCISEDEGNGRKGRYGRHMGVPLKKDDASPVSPPQQQAGPVLLPAPVVGSGIMTHDVIAALDKNKKRKR